MPIQMLDQAGADPFPIDQQPQSGVNRRHHEGRRQTLARDVGQHRPNPSLLQPHQVIEITANVTCGSAPARQLEALDDGESGRQESALDVGR